MSEPLNLAYWLAPWKMDDTPGSLTLGSWIAPEGTVSSIDLRSNEQIVEGDGYGFFAVDPEQSIEGDFLGQGDCREIDASVALNDLFSTRFGSTFQSREKLIDLIQELLVDHADPHGVDTVRPLIPSDAGNLEIHLAGISRSSRYRFKQPSKHRGKMVDVIRKEIEDAYINSESGNIPPDKWRQIWGGFCRKCRININDVESAKLLVPANLRSQKPSRPETVFTDDFSGTLGAWVTQSGTWSISSSRARCTATASACAAIRYNTPLSSADHWSDADCLEAIYDDTYGFYYVSSGSIRHSSSGNDSYYLPNAGIGVLRLGKNVSGVQTTILHVGGSAFIPNRFGCKATGSTLNGRFGSTGTSLSDHPATVTDTSLTGLYTGLTASNGFAPISFDNWYAEDAAPAITPSGNYTYFSLMMR